MGAGLTESDAWKALKQRQQEIHGSRYVGPKQEKVALGELLDALIADYTINGRRTASTMPSRVRPLREYFRFDTALSITPQRIEAYKKARLDAGKMPATVNRELAALKRAFRLGRRQQRIMHAPIIALLAENNARQGFAEPGDFEAVLAHLPKDLEDFARFAYWSGWRKGEIRTLAWSEVDKESTRVSLRREFSKNGGRACFLSEVC